MIFHNCEIVCEQNVSIYAKVILTMVAPVHFGTSVELFVHI